MRRLVVAELETSTEHLRNNGLRPIIQGKFSHTVQTGRVVRVLLSKECENLFLDAAGKSRILYNDFVYVKKSNVYGLWDFYPEKKKEREKAKKELEIINLTKKDLSTDNAHVQEKAQETKKQ